MADQPMFYVAEDRSQPGTAFASRVADGKYPKEDAKTLADWARRGAAIKLVDGETMMRMLSAWKRPPSATRARREKPRTVTDAGSPFHLPGVSHGPDVAA